jgi:hypothetical protein
MAIVARDHKIGVSPFPLLRTPALWARHAVDMQIFEVGSKTSTGLQRLAEDGNPTELLSELALLDTVESSGTAGEAPAGTGMDFVFEISASKEAPMFSVLSMVVPSNDTFIALGEDGVALLDDRGQPRNDTEIAADIATLLAAYDAGTEANQAGAMGSDMAPWQSGPNTGAAEGSSLVRTVDDIWNYPSSSALVNVSISVKEPR